MSFDKVTLRSIRKDINQALEAVGKKYGIQLDAGNCTFSDSNFTMKLKASRVNSDGTVETELISDFKRYCHLYGLQVSDLGKTFMSNGHTYVLSGLNPKATKMPIIAHRIGNPDAQYKFRESVVSKIKSNVASPQVQQQSHIDTANLPANILALLNK